MRDDILCVGEILWDALPDGLFLGGAPFNVARHLHVLGMRVAFASRVGTDRLGEEALRRVRAHGLTTDFIQRDDTRPTGFVQVALDADTGEPDYDILEPAAWDAIAPTESLMERAEQADALVFGSLAQRAPTSRQTIQRLCDTETVRVFDVNLRPPYVDRETIERTLRRSDVVKLNEDELQRLVGWVGGTSPDDPDAALVDLATRFDCTAVCVTWGEAGASLWREGSVTHHPGYEADVRDTVGAGDAFLAALLPGLLAHRDASMILDCANRLGAYVASHSGALPDYAVDTWDDLADLPLSSPSGSG